MVKYSRIIILYKLYILLHSRWRCSFLKKRSNEEEDEEGSARLFVSYSNCGVQYHTAVTI